MKYEIKVWKYTKIIGFFTKNAPIFLSLLPLFRREKCATIYRTAVQFAVRFLFVKKDVLFGFPHTAGTTLTGFSRLLPDEAYKPF